VCTEDTTRLLYCRRAKLFRTSGFAEPAAGRAELSRNKGHNAVRTASAHRELEGGVEELTDVALPAVSTIQTGTNDPRYASLRGIRQAQSKPLDVKTLKDIGLTSEELPLSLALADLSEPETEGGASRRRPGSWPSCSATRGSTHERPRGRKTPAWQTP
jgi:hypothetical protein